MAQTARWGPELKAKFRKHIERREINPPRTDKEYIEWVRQKYFPDRPINTFRNNWKASTAEWRQGQAVDHWNSVNGELFQ